MKWTLLLTQLAILSLALSAGGACNRANPPPKASGRIVVLGDSLAVSPSERAGFPSLLEDRLEALGLQWSVVNAGVRGDTTAGGLRRIDNLLATNRPDILILALGANDGLRGLDVNQMSRNLTAMIARATDQRAKVLLCGMQLPPINMLPYGRNFRKAFEEVAESENVTFVPFLLEGVAMDAKMNSADGIHPNTDGARQIAETIWPYLDELIRK